MQHGGGGIMLFIMDDVPSKLLNANTSISGIENILVEINLRSKEWLMSGSIAKSLATAFILQSLFLSYFIFFVES